MLTDMALHMLSVDSEPKMGKRKDILKMAKKERGMKGIARDMLDGMRAMR